MTKSENRSLWTDSIQEISALKSELGADYLLKEKERQKDQTKEIIIAIENQKI